MKKFFFLCILIAGFGWVAAAQDLHQGDQLVKSLKLGFNDEAKSGNAFISWELVGDWDKFDVDFSQGTLNKDVFTIKASEYKDFANGKDGITLTIQGKPKTPQGNYTLAMKVKEVSDDLNFPKNSMNLNLNINYLLPPPPPLWKRLLVPAIILLALIALLLLVLHLTAKFPGGMLQLGREEVYLRGKKKVSVKDELLKANIQLGDDVDIIFTKKRFGPFQGPCIKDIQNCLLERDGIYLSKGSVILPEEEIRGLTDNEGNEILIRYC